MLSIGKITGSPGSAAKYYVSGDYYSKDGNEPSEWAGKGAERLNLGGAVSAKDLAKLLSGVLPEGHQTGWQKANVWHHPGWDLTFSAPKGISIQSIVGGDTRLLKAHEKAVARALKFVESYAYVRVRGADQKVNYRQTGNIVAAKFTEFFSRALDPHLHTHAPISNMTYDKERGAWYALDSGALYAIKMAAGQVYRNELATACLALGYEIFRNAETGLFDIKGIPEKLIDIYSSRRKQIIAYAREKGWKSAAALATATLLTRPDKAKTNHQKVVEDLKQRGVEYLGTLQKLAKKTSQRLAPARDPKTADRAVNHGIAHLTTTEAVVEHGHVIREALKSDIGHVTIDEAEAALPRRDGRQEYLTARHETGGKHIYQGRTTDASLAWEVRLAKQILKQRDIVWSLANRDVIETHLAGSGLTDEQKAAAEFVLRSRDRAVIVSGVAGAGKSHLVKAIKEAAPNRNYLALAPTATAATDLGGSAGVQSDTLAGFLQTGGEKVGRNSVLFVDEASMSSTRQAVRLLDIAEKRKARIVFLGDVKQLDAVEQGKPFDLLIRMGMRQTFIEKSFRQKNAQMQMLVKAAREGKYAQVFATLGNRVEQHQSGELAGNIARRWIDDPGRSNIQIAALENSTRIEANAVIRKHLQEEGSIGRQDHRFTILSSKGLTTAQLSLADYYKEGDVLVFHMGHQALGIDRGEKFKVLKSHDGTVKLKRLKNGEQLDFDPGRTRKKGLTLYAEQKRNLSKGDKIQWRQNLEKDPQIKNGHTGTVEKVRGREATIKFDHGVKRILNLRDNQYWDHGYVITTYKQQGKTTPVNWIVAQTGKAGEITQKAFYVSLTRAERSVRVFTDNRQKLRSAIFRNPGGKTSSLQGRGLKINLHQVTGERQLTQFEKWVDRLPTGLRTPATNLLERIADSRSRQPASQTVNHDKETGNNQSVRTSAKESSHQSAEQSLGRER